jgi:hypothetical protein
MKFLIPLSACLIIAGSAYAGNKIERWAIADDATGEIVGGVVSRRDGPPPTKTGQRAVRLPQSFDNEDIKHLRLTADKLAIEKKSQTEIDEIEAKKNRVKSRPAIARQELKQRYASLVKKGRSLASVRSYIDSVFTSLTAPERSALAKIVHMNLLAIRYGHRDDDFYDADE